MMKKQHILIKRLYVTLLELLFVLAILGLIGGFISINVRKALYNQKFQAEVETIVDQLRLAQDLMIIFDGDVTLKISEAEDDSGLEYGLTFDHALPNQWAQQLQRNHSKLTAIRRINEYPPTYTETINMKFLSGGAVMSRCVLRFSTADFDGPDVLTRYVCLPGYPSPIFSTTTRLTEQDCLSKDETFDAQLSQRTGEEIHVQE